MYEDILNHRKAVADNIRKSFGEEIDIEKAHQVGDIHPNGKWVWTQLPSGKFDWRTIGGRAHKRSQASTETKKTPEKKTDKNSKTSAIDAKIKKYVDSFTDSEIEAFDVFDSKGKQIPSTRENLINMLKIDAKEYPKEWEEQYNLRFGESEIKEEKIIENYPQSVETVSKDIKIKKGEKLGNNGIKILKVFENLNVKTQKVEHGKLKERIVSLKVGEKLIPYTPHTLFFDITPCTIVGIAKVNTIYSNENDNNWVFFKSQSGRIRCTDVDEFLEMYKK